MGYPLIQQPAPLMQLAETIAAIRAQREARIAQDDERRMAAARDARAERYLQIQEAGLANRAQMDVAELELAKQRLGLMAQGTALDAAREQRAQRQLDILTKRQALLNAVDLPDDFRASPELRAQIVTARGDKQLMGAAHTPRVAPDVGALAADAVRNADLNPGGLPIPGTSGGITYFPRPQSATFAQPREAGTGAARVTTQDRLMRAAITGAYQQMQDMERMEARDPTSAHVPGVFATIEGAGNIPIVGGALRGALEPAAQQSLTPNQQAYQAMRREFIHTYASSLPGRRLGPELLKLLEVAFFPRAGQTDARTLATYRARRREAADRMYRAAQGEDVDLESVLPANVRARLNGSPSEAGATPPSEAGAPYVDPRFR